MARTFCELLVKIRHRGQKARFAADDPSGEPDFGIEFLTSEQRLKKLVLAVPDFIHPGNGMAEVRNAEDFQICSYRVWRS